MRDALTGVRAGVPATVGDLVDAVRARLGGESDRAGERESETRAEARDLVAAVLDVPRLWPTANKAEAMDAPTVERAFAAAARRAKGAPFAYAVGRAAFRHLTLAVDERVLIPRQETEVLIDEVLAELTEPGGIVVDVGTGSGAIALALASEGNGRFDRVIATDISLDALEVARENLRRCAPVLRSPVELRLGAFLAPVQDIMVRAIVSNPPYIALGEAPSLPRSVRDWEPAVALYGGHDGMQHIAALVRESAGRLEPGGLLAMEVDATRASLAAELVATDGRYRDVSVRLDLTGRERFVFARRR